MTYSYDLAYLLPSSLPPPMVSTSSLSIISIYYHILARRPRCRHQDDEREETMNCQNGGDDVSVGAKVGQRNEDA
eukprot:scaffold5981_cov146-Skeletonema_dohrnii-CCMP3373.AAC.3